MANNNNELKMKTPIDDSEIAVTSLEKNDKDELSHQSEESSSISTDLSSSTEIDIKENPDIQSIDDDINNISNGVTVSTNYNYKSDAVDCNNQHEVSEIISNIPDITCSTHGVEKSIDVESLGTELSHLTNVLPSINAENNTLHSPSSEINCNLFEMVMKSNNFDNFINNARERPDYNSNDMDNLNDIFNSNIHTNESGESYEKISNRITNLQANFEYMKNDIDNFQHIYNIINDLHKENEILRNGLANSRDENILYSERIKYLEISVCSLQKDTYSSYLEFKSMQDKLVALESDFDKFQQYNRRESLEVSGIPENIPQSELEITMINVLRRIGLNDLNSYQIAACHRLKRRVGNEQSSRVIIRFVNRKNSYKCLINKKYLRDIREFPNIYFHESLCFKYKDLYDDCMELKTSGKISKLWTYNGIINIKKSYNYNERPKKIFSKSDINKYFPELV